MFTFISLIEHSSFNFKEWDTTHQGIKWIKAHTSYYIDTWDQQHISAKLYFNWQQEDSKHLKFLGTGTMGWVDYNLKTQQLQESVQQTKLTFPIKWADKLKTCLQFCDWQQTAILQKRFKNQSLQTYPIQRIIGKGRAYFYSSPQKTCQTHNLFLIPKDKIYLLRSQDRFSFVAYKRKNKEIIYLWIKNTRIGHVLKVPQNHIFCSSI
ncbi:hypothetical protein [Helicobacter suis]|uniref:hypothetical protein n=1 Tax=Helicobacter suis TaxID=104628 RepID=UPI0013D786FD|nr:hypothetical protein [Helicobacter suis]